MTTTHLDRPPTTAAQAIGETALRGWIIDPYDDRNATAVVIEAIEAAGGLVLLPDAECLAVPVGLVHRAAKAIREDTAYPHLAADLEAYIR